MLENIFAQMGVAVDHGNKLSKKDRDDALSRVISTLESANINNTAEVIGDLERIFLSLNEISMIPNMTDDDMDDVYQDIVDAFTLTDDIYNGVRQYNIARSDLFSGDS
jgi:hypothetical protein